MAVRFSYSYAMGEWLLEPEIKRLSRAGQRVHLANRPFQVLLYLVENRDRVVTRIELLERFWEGRDVYDATLTQCVVAIRRALDDHQGDARFIETRWAGGYRYIGPVEPQAVGGGPSVVEVERTRGIKIVIEEEFQDTPSPSAALDAATMPARADAAPTSPTGDAGSRTAVISLPARRSSRKTSAVVLSVAVVAFAAAPCSPTAGPRAARILKPARRHRARSRCYHSGT